MFAHAPVDWTYVRDVLPVMVLLGVGIGVAFPALMTLSMSGATPEEVGGKSLADASRVEPDARGDRYGRRSDVNHDPILAQSERGVDGRSTRVEQLEGSVIPCPEDRSEHRRVVAPTGDPGAFERPLDQRQRRGGDPNGHPCQRVQDTDLAGRTEPAPPRLEVLDQVSSRVDQGQRSAHDHHVDVRTHRAKAGLSFHGCSCPRSGSMKPSPGWPTSTKLSTTDPTRSRKSTSPRWRSTLRPWWPR